MFDELFRRKKVNINKLTAYGFIRQTDGYIFSTEILNGQFMLNITISLSGQADTQVIEKENGEEYMLYKTSATGSFVGEVRTACETVMADISEKCYDVEVFKSEQAKSVIDYVREKYGDELEFLWTKFPDNAVWRRKDNNKWYGAILTVAKTKLGIKSNDIAEIIDLRYPVESIDKLLSSEGFYPGWHMNKKNWYTIILDGSVGNEELFRLIDLSYELALKK